MIKELKWGCDEDREGQIRKEVYGEGEGGLSAQRALRVPKQQWTAMQNDETDTNSTVLEYREDINLLQAWNLTVTHLQERKHVT